MTSAMMTPSAPLSGAAPGTVEPTVCTLVIEEILHDGGVVVARGRTEHDAAIRFVTRRAVTGRTPAPGETWRVVGAWQTHASYGRQLGLSDATLVRPSGRLVIDVLARSAAFPGIGAVRARRLWETHGPDLFDLLDAGDATPFSSLLGDELADVLVRGWRSLEEETKACRWLTGHGFPSGLAAKLIAIYGTIPAPAEAAEEVARKGRVAWHLEDDPYRMLAFTSWKKADAVAKRIGVARDDPRRLVGAVEAALARALADSHTWTPEDVLVADVDRLLGLGRAAARQAIALAVRRRAALPLADGYQAPGAAVMEQFVESRCVAMAAGECAAPQLRLERTMDRAEVESLLDGFEHREGYPLTPEQRAGVWMALTEPVSALLGGPGVGKTTVLKAVYEAAAAYDRTVHQAALSGRAAQRMSEATGRPASTIASLLIRIDRGEVVLDDEPLVVIDESSMVDLTTLYRLMRRFAPGVRLLLVGDPGQLPPIGFGLTFHVFAGGARIPRTTLETVMRQTEESGIPAVCRDIRRGVVPDIPGFCGTARAGVSFVDVTEDGVTNTVVDLLAALGGAHAAQVVGSVKAGPGGTVEINRVLQGLRGAGRPQLPGRFYVGDPVIATVNDYDLGVMNGELGEALAAGPGGGLQVRFDSGEKLVPAQSLDLLDLAYAVTCHKAQGSQFRRVIVPVTPNRLLDRTLLLTAVSRAQEQVVLVGDRHVFADAVTRPPVPSLRRVGLGRASAAQPVLPSTL